MGWAREGPEKRELEWELGQVQGPGEEVRGQGELRELRKLALGRGQLAEAPPLARWQMVKLAENGQKEQGQLQLKQDIYKAYTDAATALQQFTARQRSVATAEKAFDFASKRYELNLLSAFDLNNSRNNLLSARSQLLLAHYDFVFKMKLLEFYRGQGLKL